jgi:glutamate-1-semialdehyde aminotransferase/spore coat polysaccharide biosynthesis protein SpsF (cytidylyltransferase family)
MKSIAIIQARMNSTRLPGKILANLGSDPVLKWVIRSVSAITTLDQIVIATSSRPSDNLIEDWCAEQNLACFRGSENNVLERYYLAAKEFGADIILRITSDCPFLDPHVASEVLALLSIEQADFCSNALNPTWPDGLDCEAFTFKTLETTYKAATKNSHKEHVTSYMHQNQHRFKCVQLPCPLPNLNQHRWTIDTHNDLVYLNKISKHLPLQTPASYLDILATINKHGLKHPGPELRNLGYEKSVLTEKQECTSFVNSQNCLKQALHTIPLGAQTFSKSYIQFPQYTCPLFLTHGRGGRVWDVDGNEYVDLVNGLMSNVLGYCDPDTNNAITTQLSKGISLSLSTELEIQLSETLCEIIPSAEKVRFAKNGTDATSAAIRLSRAYTGREHILTCGYHGWQDWYIGSTTRNKGVPKSTQLLTQIVPYNDLNLVEEHLNTEKYAAFIMEPCNAIAPLPGYLEGIKSLCEKYGTLLVFDEMITGFRFSLGGAQAYFNVTPHLSCFGKALSNGMPLSAIVGKREIMNEMEDIFFSGTFGGEALSIASAIATIDKIKREPVIQTLWQNGNYLSMRLDNIITECALENIFSIQGYDPWKIILIKGYEDIPADAIKTLFLQEMLIRGVLISASHNICYAHSTRDLAQVIAAYEEALPYIKKTLIQNKMNENLRSPIIKPLFKIR